MAILTADGPTASKGWLSRWVPVVLIIAAAVIAHTVLRQYMGAFVSKIVLDVGINVVLAVSLTLVNGFTGQFSIGHAAFMAVGGYTAASITYYVSMVVFGGPEPVAGALSTMISGRENVPLFAKGDAIFAGSLVVGGLVAAGCGFLVGLPSLRLKGDYLAIVTLGFGEIFRVLIQQTADVAYYVEDVKDAPLVGVMQVFSSPRAEWEAPIWARLGGPVGFTGIPTYNSLFWTLLVTGLTLLVAYRLKRSTHGRAMLSIREDEVASESMGVNTTRYKVRAFVIAAFFAGVAGALFAHTTGVTLKANELAFAKSFDIIIMVVLGGLGSISGASLAAVILTMLPELLRKPEQLVAMWPWAAGVVVVGVVCTLLAKNKIGGGAVARAGGLGIGLGGAALVLAGLGAIAMRAGLDLSQYRMVLYALALILMMILRPSGIMGVRELWERAFWRGGC